MNHMKCRMLVQNGPNNIVEVGHTTTLGVDVELWRLPIVVSPYYQYSDTSLVFEDLVSSIVLIFLVGSLITTIMVAPMTK